MLAVNTSSCLSANTMLIFQEGNHTLNSTLAVLDIDNLRLSANNSITNANIICSENASLKFTNISQLWISRLTFIGCSSSLEFVQQFNLQDSTHQDGSSGLIATRSNVIITNSSFERNTADIGGAILIEMGSNVTINNCTFANNSAAGCSNDNCGGGALFVDSDCFVEVKYSTFTNNTSEYNGGAITLVQAEYVGEHNIYSYNKASGSGGAVFVYNDSNIVEDNSHFSSNIARKDGGAVFASGGSSITMDNSFFSNNLAFDHGGVLFVSNYSNINTSSSYFNQNEAGEYKEILLAIIGGSIPVYYRTLLLENLTHISGGGVMYASQNSSITIDNSSFSNNTGSFNGGVLHANTYSSITITCSYFSNNVAGNDGGTAYILMYSNMTVRNTTFQDSLAISGGGALFASDESNIYVNSSFFTDNEAGRFGGALFAWMGSSIALGNSCLDSNRAGRTRYALDHLIGRSGFSIDQAGGAVFLLKQSNIIIMNSSIINNEAGACGGGLFTDSSVSIIHNSNFSKNSAGNEGGGIFADLSTITINNTFFGGNSADKSGGVIYADLRSTVTVNNTHFNSNTAGATGGVAHANLNSTIIAENSMIHNNTASYYGGFVYADTVIITIRNCFFGSNSASIGGGILFTVNSIGVHIDNNSFTDSKAGYGGVIYIFTSENIIVNNSHFENNQARQEGGAIYASLRSKLIVYNSLFIDNEAKNHGGVLSAFHQCNISFTNYCRFLNNAAHDGGVASMEESNLSDVNSEYSHNRANDNGGVIYANEGNVQITASNFTNNSAENSGGVFYSSTLSMALNGCLFHNNSGESGGVIALLSYGHLTSMENTFKFNVAQKGGVIFLLKGNSLVINNDVYVHNLANDSGGVVYSENQNNLTVINCTLTSNQAHKNGGAIYSSLLTEMTITGILEGNQALRGGAIYSSMSKISVQNYCIVENNYALSNGGGSFLTMSTIRFNDTFFVGNRARGVGGGLHTARSNITIEGTANFTNNEAENGGGVSLESNTKIVENSIQKNVIVFTSNRARNHGGALFIDDATTPDLCAAVIAGNESPTAECFTAASVSYAFSNNYASASGSNLFGGLLDRCTVHGEHIQWNESKSGVSTFQKQSNINKSDLDTVWSHPVLMCFCRDNLPDCDYHPGHIQVSRGKGFTLELTAYDQVRHTVNATIYSSLSSSAGGLGEDQVIQHINRACTELHFNLFTPIESTYLTLSLEGPCNVAGISKAVVRIDNICYCPIGFQILRSNKAVCDCICDEVLLPYEKTECNTTTNSIIRKDNFWLTYINNTNGSSGYVIHPNCPFDYCHPPEKHVSINLNLPHGSDAQCASNRSGTLCGYCKPGLSVSLGSTHCLRCPTYWPGLLVVIILVAILSGIGLIVLMLILNLTVAVGTLNAIIFYANIVAANKGVLFPTSEETSFAYVIVSWLNFDLGIDVCFLNGMDTYLKTWFQLAFTGYIIFLVFVTIQLSHRFDRFGRLIGKKDPVATLATLVLLSNTKLITLLQTIISTFLPVVLKFPDGSQQLLWLPDATVAYLSPKHALLLITATLVILVGFIYSILVFSWQWILYCPRKRVKWIKLSSFFESYHVPYNPKHRYWTGLLLFVRGTIYLISAFNSPGDPRITLLSTNFIVSFLLFYIAIFGIRMYKSWLMNAMETATYINIIILAIFAQYYSEVITVSVGIIFVQLLAVILYHIYTYANIKILSRIQNSSGYKKLKKILPSEHVHYPSHRVPADLTTDIDNRFIEFIDISNNSDNASQSNVTPSDEPTHSVVEIALALQLGKATEEPDSKAQQQQNKQQGVPAPKPEDSQKPKSGGITEQARSSGTAFTPQMLQTNNDSEHTSFHHGVVEMDVHDQ